MVEIKIFPAHNWLPKSSHPPSVCPSVCVCVCVWDPPPNPSRSHSLSLSHRPSLTISPPPPTHIYTHIRIYIHTSTYIYTHINRGGLAVESRCSGWVRRSEKQSMAVGCGDAWRRWRSVRAGRGAGAGLQRWPMTEDDRRRRRWPVLCVGGGRAL